MKDWIIAGGMACVIAVAVAACYTVPVWFLWNWVMPDVLHVGEISLGQAWALLTLCSILFKSNPSTPDKDAA